MSHYFHRKCVRVFPTERCTLQPKYDSLNGNFDAISTEWNRWFHQKTLESYSFLMNHITENSPRKLLRIRFNHSVVLRLIEYHFHFVPATAQWKCERVFSLQESKLFGQHCNVSPPKNNRVTLGCAALRQHMPRGYVRVCIINLEDDDLRCDRYAFAFENPIYLYALPACVSAAIPKLRHLILYEFTRVGADGSAASSQPNHFIENFLIVVNF